jgi:hypothetical protein
MTWCLMMYFKLGLHFRSLFRLSGSQLLKILMSIPCVTRAQHCGSFSNLPLQKTLQREIEHFLLMTAKWSCDWFNKSKFHVILHLPKHIQQFGPAMLFATEAFESFNAVIRAKSIHSNRQAPSRDIAMAFAQGNRVRHLLSGGYFIPAELEEPGKSFPIGPEQFYRKDWRTVGPGPLRLLDSDTTVQHYLGLFVADLESLASSSGRSQCHHFTGLILTQPLGRCKRDKHEPRPFAETITGTRLPGVFHSTPGHPQRLFVTGSEVHLLNGDRCRPRQHVIIQHHDVDVNTGVSSSVGPAFIACVREIIQQHGSQNYDNSQPDGILVQTVLSSDVAAQFQMPALKYKDEYSFVPLSVSVLSLKLKLEFAETFSRISFAPLIRSTIAQLTTARQVAFVMFIKNVYGASSNDQLSSI